MRLLLPTRFSRVPKRFWCSETIRLCANALIFKTFPRNARVAHLPGVFSHVSQKFLSVASLQTRIFVSSDEKSDCAITTPIINHRCDYSVSQIPEKSIIKWLFQIQLSVRICEQWVDRRFRALSCRKAADMRQSVPAFARYPSTAGRNRFQEGVRAPLRPYFGLS